MADLFELDESALSSIDYHWLWGLRYSPRPRAINMALALKTLLADDERLGHIIAQQDLLASRYVIVRLFYWLFNIDNYSYHSYLLVACKAYGAYLDNDFENGARMKQAHEGSWRLLENFSTALMSNFSYIRLRFYRALGAMMAVPVGNVVEDEDIDDAVEDINEALSSTALVVQKTMRVEAPAAACIVADDEGESVIVTEAMCPHLEVLELHLNIGDLLSIAAFKSASRARYLASHPDRPGGSHAAFCRAQEAATCLTEMISIGLNADVSEEVEVGAGSAWANAGDYFKAEMAASDVIFKAQEIIFEAESQVRVRLVQARAQKVPCQELDRVSREFDRVSNETSKVSHEMIQVFKELSRVFNSLNRDIQERAWLSQELDKLSQAFEKESQALDRISQALDSLFQEHAQKSPERDRVYQALVRVSQYRDRVSQERIRVREQEHARGYHQERTALYQEFERVSQTFNQVSQELTQMFQEHAQVYQEHIQVSQKLAQISQQLDSVHQDLAQVSQALDRSFQEHALAPEREGQNAGVTFFAPARERAEGEPVIDEPGAAPSNLLPSRKG